MSNTLTQLEFPFMSETLPQPSSILSPEADFIYNNILTMNSAETALTRVEILTEYQKVNPDIQPGTVKSALNQLKTSGHILEDRRKTGRKGKPPAIFFRKVEEVAS